MSKKDYIKFANMVKALVNETKSPLTPNAARESEQLLYCSIFSNKMADIFAQDNPLFDRDRFLKACGLQN